MLMTQYLTRDTYGDPPIRRNYPLQRDNWLPVLRSYHTQSKLRRLAAG